MQKILNIISVLSFLLVLSISGIGTYGYLYLTNEENQEKLKKQMIEQVTGSLKMPGLSGPVLPTAKPKAAGSTRMSLPKF